MRTYTRTFLALGLVLGAFAGSVTAAEAATLQFSPAGNFTSASLGHVTFSGGTIFIRCNLTLSGTLASSITATAGAHMGMISSVSSSSCEGGTVRSILWLPWYMHFNRLTGTGVEGFLYTTAFEFSVTIFGIVVNCLYEGVESFLIAASAGRSALMILQGIVNKWSGAGTCPSSLTVNGTFGLSPQQAISLF